MNSDANEPCMAPDLHCGGCCQGFLLPHDDEVGETSAAPVLLISADGNTTLLLDI